MSTKRQILSFLQGNAKIGKEPHTFSLPSGHTCPGATECLARADRNTGTITDGPDQRVRCFAATMEARFGSVRKSRWRNFELLIEASRAIKDDPVAGMTDLLVESMTRTRPVITAVRVHVGGDFFNEAYFKAWMRAAEALPNVEFWAYTKSIPYWVKNQDIVPSNFSLTASDGGRYDHFIPDLENAKTAYVVFSEEEAAIRGWEIDHDDSAARYGKEDFALLVHGTQPTGTEASTALNTLRRNGVRHSYPQEAI